jgi:uroporphyrinogen decarboxylase
MKPVTKKALSSSTRVAMPILTFPGGRLIGASVKQMVHDAAKQTAAQLLLRDRFHSPALLSAMDLSAEAEEFGATVQFSDHEVPTVIGRLVSDLLSVDSLPVPPVGSKRTRVYLDTIRYLSREKGDSLLLAGLIGPFSLAGRLFGVSEALLATAMEPEGITPLVEKTTRFLIAYARAFKNAGADGLIMAEPTAGLMSPAAMMEFSSSYIRRIIDAVEDQHFQVVLHNCGARIGHLAAKRESGASVLHFGKPMDIVAALKQVPPDFLICGNLDPAGVFINSTPGEVASLTEQLLAETAGYRNFIISSGCDIPAHSPMANIDAFFSAVAQIRHAPGGTP